MIIHTAAQVAVTTPLEGPVTDFEVNALVRSTCLKKRATTTRFVLSSTNKVYRERVNPTPIVEKQTRYEFADPL